MTQLHIRSLEIAQCGKWVGTLGVALIGLWLLNPGGLPISPGVSAGLVLLSVTGLFTYISVNDFKTRRVSNAVTYPLMMVGIIHALIVRDATFLAYWLVVFGLWAMRLMGGGDAKLLMGLFGVYPEIQLAQFVAISVIVTGLPYLGYKYRRTWQTLPRALFRRLLTQQWLPTQAEFDQEAVPFVFSFCLAGWVYILMRLAPFLASPSA